MMLIKKISKKGGARSIAIVLLIVLAPAAYGQQGEQVAEEDVRVRINPTPRAELSREPVHGWRCEDLAGWRAVNHIRAAKVRDGVLAVESTSFDPYLVSPQFELESADTMRVRARIRSEAGGKGQIFWATSDDPHFTEPNSTRFSMQHDGQWHEYSVPITATGTLTQLRLDPAEAAGPIDIAEVTIERIELHPLEIAWIETDGRDVQLDVRYHGKGPADVRVELQYKAGATEWDADAELALHGPGSRQVNFVLNTFESPVARVDLEASMEGVEPVRRRIRLHREDVATPDSWPTMGDERLTVRLHPRSLFARIYRDGERVALIGPLVMLAGGDSAGMDVEVNESGDAATLVGEEASVELRVEGGHLYATVEAEQQVEALITRVLGRLEQGLLPGVEYLGAGEWSSSKADIETDEHIRFAPPPMHVTMPLMAFVTDRVSVGLLYDEPAENAPIFATPNFFDGSADHRMSVRGRRIEAVYRVEDGWDEQRLEDVIEWALLTRGLAEVPEPPRTTQQQFDLALHALNGVLRNEDGWGHCAEERWVRRFFSDLASTTWRLSGEMPDVPELVRGGAHLPDDASYFVSGRAQQWLNQINGQAAALRNAQQDDGSFRYDGPYARTHFENTASGYNAQRAATLLTHALYTGNEASREAGLKTLQYMKRFRTPRGAQTWEMPLHTPDILGAGRLVHAYVLGYRLTDEPLYLELARRWAVSGLPFLYQWQAGDDPTMRYAVIAVKGATNWVSPNWIGLPVQWCGLPYADALLLLSKHDESFPWRQVAEGILVSGERMMYGEGELAGTLPDFYFLESGERGGPSINPSAMVSLRKRFEGRLGNVAVAESNGQRIVSPYPVTIDGSVARIEAEPGRAYQVVIDGRRVVDVESRGVDQLPLD